MTVKTKILIALYILLLILIFLFIPLPVVKGSENQIVLEYVTSVDNIRFFVPKDRMAIGVVPVGNPAPIAPGTLAICKLELTAIGIKTADGKQHGPVNEIVFRCGEDKYIFTSLAIEAKK